MKQLLEQFFKGSLFTMFGKTNGRQRSENQQPGNRTADYNANITSLMTSSINGSPKQLHEVVSGRASSSADRYRYSADINHARSSLVQRRSTGAPSWSSGFETSSSVLSLSFQSSGPPSPDHRTPQPTLSESRDLAAAYDCGTWSRDGTWSIDRFDLEKVSVTRRSSIDTVTSLTNPDVITVAPWLRSLNESSESTRPNDDVTFDNGRPAMAAVDFEENSSVSSGAVATPRTVNEISTSLAANIARLGRDRRAVDEAFGRARSEERIKRRELANIRRQVSDARRQILIETLRRLGKELNGQGSRLQAAYDTVLTHRWRQLNATQEQQS